MQVNIVLSHQPFWTQIVRVYRGASNEPGRRAVGFGSRKGHRVCWWFCGWWYECSRWARLQDAAHPATGVHPL